MLAKTAGTVRYCYNWGLAKWNEMYKNGEDCSKYTLSKLWTVERPDWAKEVARGAQTQALMNLGAAFSAFFKKRAGRPAFHKKGRKDSFYVQNDKGWLKDGKRIHLPNIGDVRMAEELRFKGDILRFVVSKLADGWYVSITVELDEEIVPADSETAIGIDVGIKHWAVASDGTVLDKPKAIPRLEKSLKHAQRELSRRQKGSKNRGCKASPENPKREDGCGAQVHHRDCQEPRRRVLRESVRRRNEEVDEIDTSRRSAELHGGTAHAALVQVPQLRRNRPMVPVEQTMLEVRTCEGHARPRREDVQVF